MMCSYRRLPFNYNAGPVRPAQMSSILRRVQTGSRAGPPPPLAAVSVPSMEVVPAAEAAPVVDGGPAVDRTVVQLADFVPEPVARGQVPARVSRSMTATGAQPLVQPDIDGGSLERQARQALAHSRGERPLPPQPPPAP